MIGVVLGASLSSCDTPRHGHEFRAVLVIEARGDLDVLRLLPRGDRTRPSTRSTYWSSSRVGLRRSIHNAPFGSGGGVSGVTSSSLGTSWLPFWPIDAQHDLLSLSPRQFATANACRIPMLARVLIRKPAPPRIKSGAGDTR